MSTQEGPVMGPELLLALDRAGAGSLHDQLERALRGQIRSGRLTPGAQLPSSRGLARTLGVSRGVVLEAYSQLVAEGYLTASQGAPTRVALAPNAERPPVAATSLETRYAYDFDPGLPDLAGFPRDRWSQSLRAAVRDASIWDMRQGDPRGTPELRNALMDYLGRVRGAAPEPEHTVICGGFTQGFAVLCRALCDRGVHRIAIEDPGWAKHRLIAERAGLEPVGVLADAYGIDVASLRASGCEVVVVTPAHQFPTGVVLSSKRRAALLEWAQDADGLIVEDDYDSELRYDRGAVGALQGLAPERVAHIGSLSKRLVPALRIGWLLSPSWLTGALVFEKGLADSGSPVLEQLALAGFIARGELDRHLRRMRLRYRARRQVLRGAIARELPVARVIGVEAGLYAPVLLGRDADESAVITAAAARGVAVEGLASHRFDEPDSNVAPGLLIGYANSSEGMIEQGVALLAAAVAQCV